ncbi:MAG: DNA polymerase III subunit alpha, partial [Phycisphaerales bacterium]|nr:DNA polymerase III subunit alpha [Phycisphaerales bacterium]
EYELSVITSKGFASYFLIVWDCVRFARSQGIPIGARGSGCSSVVAHCLFISTPDPIRYELYFERFLDPDRDEMPDIDLDICQNGRAAVLDYVRNKYGHVAQIITFGTLKAKAAVKDVARVMGLGFDEANQLTKLIPSELNITLDKALAQEPELKRRYLADPTVKKIIDIARRLEGVARNSGVHAAGVVVADQPLVNLLPLCRASGGDAIVTQFDGPTVEKVGLLKMDFLGLRTLTTLERARQLAERATGTAIDLDRIDLTDQRVYELFSRGETKGIFQFESGGMRDVVMRMKPNRIEDLIAANALFRPGPMEYIPEYVARKHGQSWNTPHPIMTEVLSETYGIMVYQEQVSRLVNRLGGLELKAAFRLAKAISKKKTSMIEAMREPFLAGCEKNGVRRETAEQIFEDILKFGGYAFNKAHSTGYALIAYQTAWMKTYFPVEFMAALMTFEMSSIEKIAEYREECKGLRIGVEPPEINTSEFDFMVESVSGDNGAAAIQASTNGNGGVRSAAQRQRIRFGLGAIKGVGQKAVAAIVEERTRGGTFRNLFDFCERVDLTVVNRGTIEALICAGAFDRTGGMRKALFDAVDRAIVVGQSVQQDRRCGQMALFDAGDAARHECRSSGNAAEPALSNAEWSEADMLAREKAVLGFYITKHPLAQHEQLLAACANATTAQLIRMTDGQKVIVGGMVSSVRAVPARTGRNAGKLLGIVTLEDLKGKVEAVLFPEEFLKFRSVLTPDAIVFVEGEVDRKREEPSIRVSRVVPVDLVSRDLAKSLLIDVQTDTGIERLVAALRAHRGECRVYLNVATVDGAIVQIECNPSLRVACTSELFAALGDLVPPHAVRIVGPQRQQIPVHPTSPTAASAQPVLV